MDSELVKLLSEESKRIFNNDSDLILDIKVWYSADLITSFADDFLSHGYEMRFLIIKKPEILSSLVIIYLLSRHSSFNVMDS